MVSWEVFWGPGLIGPGRSRAYLILFDAPAPVSVGGSRCDVRPPDRRGQLTALGGGLKNIKNKIGATSLARWLKLRANSGAPAGAHRRDVLPERAVPE